MREKFADYVIKKSNAKNKYSDEQIEILNYKLQCAYTLTTKLVGIVTLSIVLGIWKETLILMAFYTPLRIFGFGFHANSNLQCWIISSTMYLLVPYLLKVSNIPYNLLLVLSIISTIILAIYAPADTEKRPIISRKIVKTNKILTSIVSVIYLIFIIFNQDLYISKLMMGAQLLQAIYVTPIIYHIFKQQFNNGKKYLANEMLNTEA